jgi:hypothetical protein
MVSIVNTHHKITQHIQQAITLIPATELSEIVIFGSSAIVLNGVDLQREVNDLDLFVSSASFARLQKLATGYKHKTGEVYALQLGNTDIEILKTFPGVSYDEVLNRAESRAEFCGMKVAALDDLLRWKRAQNRPKDIADSALLEQFIAKFESPARPVV